MMERAKGKACWVAVGDSDVLEVVLFGVGRMHRDAAGGAVEKGVFQPDAGRCAVGTAFGAVGGPQHGAEGRDAGTRTGPLAFGEQSSAFFPGERRGFGQESKPIRVRQVDANGGGLLQGGPDVGRGDIRRDAGRRQADGEGQPDAED